MTRSLTAVLTATITALLFASSASAQQNSDHLLVYKIQAVPRIPVDYSMDLAAAAPELAALGCRLKAGSRARQLLAPVDKRNVSPTPPNPEIGGHGLDTDYLCYKVECAVTDTAIQLTRKNQFLSHDVKKARIRRVCVPSETSAPPTTVPTCSQQGASCTAGETCCAGLFCCEGVPVPQGQEFCGSACPISDREQKENFTPIDASEVLDRVADLEITSWNYTAEGTSVRHLGPMAQDFKAAFGLGSTDKAIFLVDADGVALTAIQALNRELESLREENATLRRNLESVDARLADVERR